MAKNTSVIGIFPDRSAVAEAIASLQKAGFRTVDFAVLMSENTGTKDFAHEKSSKAPEGSSAGALIGALAGGLLGFALASQSTSIPALNALVNSGPVISALALAGGGALVGWLIGLLIGLGFPEYVAKRYSGRVRGGILLSVHCDSAEWCNKARKIMENTGGRYISAAAEARGAYATSDKPAPRDPSTPLVEHNEAA